jgi:hypothetical protein
MRAREYFAIITGPWIPQTPGSQNGHDFEEKWREEYDE